MASVYRSTDAHVADLVGASSEMDSLADRIEASARTEAAKDRLTGAYGRAIVTEVAGNGKDRVVSATDPAALHIELGHVTSRGNKVPGKHTMRRAYEAL